jgi:hypothetical protein
MDGEAFALTPVCPYLVAMNKYSPLVSEFGSAEEEAAYNEWFRKKVEASIADPRPRVPHDEAMARVRATLERARAKAKKC